MQLKPDKGDTCRQTMSLDEQSASERQVTQRPATVSQISSNPWHGEPALHETVSAMHIKLPAQK